MGLVNAVHLRSGKARRPWEAMGVKKRAPKLAFGHYSVSRPPLPLVSRG